MFTPKTLIKRRFDINDIIIKLNNTSNRDIDNNIHAEVQKKRDTIVEKDKKNGKNRWDGTFYRIENLSDLNDAAEPIKLELNTIKYRYLATMNDYMEYYKASPERYPNHLSTWAMIQTSDWYYIFWSRTGSGDVDIIGWWAQADELEIQTWKDLENNLRKEMLEEAWITDKHIQSLEWIWFVFSFKSNILLIGEAILTINKEELEEVFLTRQDNEMAKLIFISKDDIVNYMSKMTSFRPLLPDLLE